jgi:hypothetical protein
MEILWSYCQIKTNMVDEIMLRDSCVECKFVISFWATHELILDMYIMSCFFQVLMKELIFWPPIYWPCTCPTSLDMIRLPNVDLQWIVWFKRLQNINKFSTTPTYLVDEPHVIHGNHAQMSESTLKWTYFGHFWVQH